MKHITVLGPGCANCTQTTKLIEKVAEELGLDVAVEKETSVRRILEYGAMSTPGVVVEEELVHAGGVPTAEQVRAWLS